MAVLRIICAIFLFISALVVIVSVLLQQGSRQGLGGHCRRRGNVLWQKQGQVL